jgi:hypothetical protein
MPGPLRKLPPRRRGAAAAPDLEGCSLCLDGIPGPRPYVELHIRPTSRRSRPAGERRLRPKLLPYLTPTAERLLWVATRPPPLRIHRRKAASEVPTPESSRSSPSAADPIQPSTIAPPAAEVHRMQPLCTEHWTHAIGRLAVFRWQCGASVAITGNDESSARPVLEIWPDRCCSRPAHR